MHVEYGNHLFLLANFFVVSIGSQFQNYKSSEQDDHIFNILIWDLIIRDPWPIFQFI